MIIDRENKELSQESLKELLHYNSETGDFIWLDSYQGPIKAGDIAGTISSGYINIRIKRVSYKAHRLAWLYTYGRWPKSQIDHINRDKHDNRIANLREATHQQNVMNQLERGDNLLGIKGVSKSGRKYVARIFLDGVRYHLGRFDTIEGAISARRETEKQLFKEYAPKTKELD